MKAKIAAAAIAAVAALAASHASATVLTFEGHSNDLFGSPITLSGFVLGNDPQDEQHFHLIDSTQFGLASNGTGVLLNDRDSRLFLRAVDFSSFLLTSFDIAASFNNYPGATYSVTGYLGGNQTGQLTGALDQFATVAGGSLGNVDYVVFDGSGGVGGGFELDNVTLNEGGGNAVPEPATWALMILGFGSAGAMLRRRKAVIA